MSSLKDYNKIVVASHNSGKIKEIKELLEPLGFEVISAVELNLPDVEETAKTYEGNAELKAVFAAKTSGCPALSDDSGLSVDALDGAPGIYSARWTENENGERDWALGMQRVHDAMVEDGDGETGAAFYCALCIAFPDESSRTYLGKVEGDIVWPPRGEKGFGYDPIFQPKGFDISFGQMEPQKKHSMSHRADAFAKFIASEFPK